MVAPRFRFAFIAAIVALGGTVGLADSIYLFNPDGSPALKPFRENVTILKNKEKSFVFRTGSGLEQEIQFEKVARIAVTADAALSEADDSFASRNFDNAVDLYLKAMRTNEAWKIQWVTPRLAEAAGRTNRFDAALSAYIGYARIDPPSAVASKPTLPAKGSKFLDDAAKQLDTALRSAGSDGEKQALLSLLLDVQMQRGDQASAEATANQLTTLTGDASDPRIVGMIVCIRLDQAASDINAGRFDRAASILNAVRAKTTQPAQQAQSLFLLAKAAQGTAGEDRSKQLDAAIAFMRVAAHFSSVEGKPHVAEALLEAAKINQVLGDREAAKLLCEQIASDFAGTACAEEALRRQAEMNH